MTPAALRFKLHDLITTWENEVVEFKEVSNDYDTDRIRRYFSTLANEANLRDADAGWLVFGVSNKTRTVVGTSYRSERERLDGLKQQIAQGGDRVRKGLKVLDGANRALKRKGLVKGRRPNLRVSGAVAAASSRQAEYIKTSAFDDQHYTDLVLKFLSKFGSASRKQIDELLWDKLSDALNDSQKKSKIGNILKKLRVGGLIFNAGSRAAPEWKGARMKREHPKKESRKDPLGLRKRQS